MDTFLEFFKSTNQDEIYHELISMGQGTFNLYPFSKKDYLRDSTTTN